MPEPKDHFLLGIYVPDTNLTLSKKPMFTTHSPENPKKCYIQRPNAVHALINFDCQNQGNGRLN